MDRDGRFILDNYDADNRLTGETWLSSSSSVTLNSATFTFDNVGNHADGRRQQRHGVDSSYDAQNREISTTDVFGLTLNYGYDGNGNDTSTTDSLSGSTTSTYNADDQLTSRKFTDGTTPLRVDFAYNADWRRNHQHRRGTPISPAAVRWATPIMATTRVAALTGITPTGSSSTTLSAYTYEYDKANRVTQRELDWPRQRQHRQWQPQLQLRSAPVSLLSADSTNYSYDSNSNRTNVGLRDEYRKSLDERWDLDVQLR